MARPKAVEVDANVAAEAIPEEAGGDGSNSLFDASHDARVRVLRRDDTTQKMVTHGYMPPTVSEEDVAQRFGGGHYRAQLFLPDPATGSPKVKRSRDFDIPGPYKPPTKILSIDEAGPNAPQNSNGAVSTQPQIVGGGDDLMQVLKAGIINTLLEMMKSTKEMNNRPAPTTDPLMLEFMKAQAAATAQAAESNRQMMQFMLTLLTKESGAEKDTLGMLAKMKEIVTPPAAANAADPMKMFNTMLETFTRMREVATDIAPQSGDGVDPIIGSIPKVVEVLTEQHQLNKAAREAAAQQRITSQAMPGPAGGVAHMPVVSTLPPAEELPMWQKAIRQQAHRVIAAAVAKDNPDDVAAAAVMFAPPALKESFKIFFHRDEEAVTADVLTEIPALAEHRGWLVEFVNAIQYRLFPEEFSDEGEDDAGAESGTS